MKEGNITEKLEGDEAIEVLQRLLKKNKTVKKTVESTIKEFLNEEIEVEDIAASVQMELEGLAREEVWERAGKHSYGYVEPSEAAYEMYGEVLERYQKDLKRYLDLKKHNHALQFCQGVLRGIYLFEEESDSDYKEWAPDCSGIYFEDVLDQWKKADPGSEAKKRMKKFIENKCPGWEPRKDL